MQRNIGQRGGSKKILATHKKNRYYASHRMLKRSRRGANPDSAASETLPTCHGCLLHPPPLVDLARDLTISGFFLSAFELSLFCSGPRRVIPPAGGRNPRKSLHHRLRVFPWIFRVCRGGKLYNRFMNSVFPRVCGRVTARPRHNGVWLVHGSGARTLRSVPVNCTSLSLPYMGVTPAIDNGGPVSIDQPEVTQ
jgi:hypothetical protein